MGRIVWNTQDFSYLLWYGCAASESCPKLTWSMEMTPIDFTAEVITRIATEMFTQCVGKVFHLTSKDNPDWSTVCTWMKKAGYPLKTVEYKEWIEKYVMQRKRILLVVFNDIGGLLIKFLHASGML